MQKAIDIAKESTPSMGKFDKANQGKLTNKDKKKKIAHFDNIGKEKSRDLEILEMIGKSEGSKKLKRE